MTTDADRYEAYYADKLWALLPSIYRVADAVEVDDRGPLRELVERIGAQAAILRRSIDRLWEDQSIETCDDWVIPYIADLLATNLVAGLDARGMRLDVAKTIHYRRRKGTVGVLEEIAHDITGWDACVVEFFRRIARARHGLDPQIGWPLDRTKPNGEPTLAVAEGLLGRRTRTPLGGLADLRDVYGASRAAYTAFDESAHTVDVRHGSGRVGWQNIPRLGVFVWRLYVVGVVGVDPVQFQGCPNKYAFDPTGRTLPLFAPSSRQYGDAWVSAQEHQLPTSISRLMLRATLDPLYAVVDPSDPTKVDDRAFGLYDGSSAPAALVPRASFTDDLRTYGPKHAIDPEKGILYLATQGGRPATPLVSYCSAFSSNIGAGAYDRAAQGDDTPTPSPVTFATGGGTFALPTKGTLEIEDSRTYSKLADVTIDADAKLVLTTSSQQRPLLRFGLDNGVAHVWRFVGATAGGRGSSLWLDGIFVSGADLRLEGELDAVTITMSTLDPGSLDDQGVVQIAVDGQALVPSRVVVAGNVKKLVIDRSIVGPIVLLPGGLIESLEVRDSIVQSHGTARAIDVDTGRVELLRSTILGPAHVRQIEASEAILHDVFETRDYQQGCVRFSAFAKGSTLPRRYACFGIEPRAQLFGSIRFGDPKYAQLLDGAPDEIVEGAQNGSEMGAFGREKNAIKERGLLQKLREYMPVGLAPVVIHVT